MDHIHTITRLTEVFREYKRPLRLTFIDLREAFDSVMTEAVIEALKNRVFLLSTSRFFVSFVKISRPSYRLSTRKLRLTQRELFDRATPFRQNYLQLLLKTSCEDQNETIME